MTKTFNFHVPMTYQYFDENGYHFLKNLTNSYRNHGKIKMKITDNVVTSRLVYPHYIHQDCKYLAIKDKTKKYYIYFERPVTIYVYNLMNGIYLIEVEECVSWEVKNV